MSENPLRPFLLRCANAIRAKKPKKYEEVMVSTYTQANTVLTEKTGYGVTDGSDFCNAFTAASQPTVTIYAVNGSTVPCLFLLGTYTVSGLALTDVSISADGSGMAVVTNNTNTMITINEYSLNASSKFGDIVSQNTIASGQSYSLNKFYMGKFSNYVKEEVTETIEALDFPDEILNLPEAGELYGDLVLDAPFQLDSGTSQRPGPYDQDGYNYDPSILTPAASNTTSKTLTKSLTDYEKMYIIWNMTGSRNPYGDIWSKVTVAGTQISLYEDYSNVINGDVVTEINISEVTGTQTLVFTNYAYTRSSYRDYISQAITNVKGIYVK